jgi:hypothetical protein
VAAHFSNTTLSVVKYNNIANNKVYFVMNNIIDTGVGPALKSIVSTDVSNTVIRMTVIRGTDLVVAVTGAQSMEVYEQ